jgi:hypothetical protein
LEARTLIYRSQNFANRAIRVATATHCHPRPVSGQQAR